MVQEVLKETYTFYKKNFGVAFLFGLNFFILNEVMSIANNLRKNYGIKLDALTGILYIVVLCFSFYFMARLSLSMYYFIFEVINGRECKNLNRAYNSIAYRFKLYIVATIKYYVICIPVFILNIVSVSIGDSIIRFIAFSLSMLFQYLYSTFFYFIPLFSIFEELNEGDVKKSVALVKKNYFSIFILLLITSFVWELPFLYYVNLFSNDLSFSDLILRDILRYSVQIFIKPFSYIAIIIIFIKSTGKTDMASEE